jgi:hypothetical protein
MNLNRVLFCLTLSYGNLAQAQWISVGIMGGVPASEGKHKLRCESVTVS